MSIDFTTFEDEVLAWFKAETGLAFARWMHRKTKRFQAKQWGELHVLSVQGLGVDEVIGALGSGGAGADFDQQVSGQRLITVSCRVKSRSQNPTFTARHFLEKARTSLRKPSVRATYFVPNNIAIVRHMALVDLDFRQDSRIVSLTNLDIVFATSVNEADDATTFIEKTVVSSDIKNAGGVSIAASLQLDNLELP